MKRTFYFFIIIMGITNYKKNTDNNLDNVFLQPNSKLYAVLDSFVQENNINNYVYELYIDKKTPHDYILTIYCGAKSLTMEENNYNVHIPLNYTLVSGKQFNVFSGIEHYFRKKMTPLSRLHKMIIWRE